MSKKKPTYEELEKRVRKLDKAEAERKLAEEALQKRTHDLGERVKELNCLYGLSRLVERSDISLEKIYQGSADLIPPSWQYPENTCARITIDDKEFKTDSFKKTKWKQSSDINVHGKKAGEVEVFYLEKRPIIDEGTFLKEERNLINALSEQLGHITERKRAEEALLLSESNLSSTLNSIGDAVIATDTKGNITRMNPVAENLTGWTFEDAEGKPLTELFHIVNAQTRKKAVNPVNRVLESGNIVGLANHTMLIAKHGAEYQIADSAASIQDTDGNIEYVNPKFTETSGYSFEELVGKKPSLLKSGKNIQKVYRELWETLTSGRAIAPGLHMIRRISLN